MTEMSVTEIQAGDIGEGQREWEFEPFGEPAAEPVLAPTPEREPVPA